MNAPTLLNDTSYEATRILAVRHGETAWNVESRLQGQLDIPLNPQGQRQAELAAHRLADEAPDAIYSSDLSRALATAQAIAARCQLPIAQDAGLRERHFGVWQGQTYAEVDRQWPDLALRWRKREPGFGPQDGETLETFYARCTHTLTQLALRHPGQTLVVVTHGGVLDCFHRMAAHVSLDAPRTWELPNTGINRLLFTGRHFSLIGWADVQHLLQPVLDEASVPLGTGE